MEVYQQSQPNGLVMQLRGKENAPLGFTASIPYHQAIQRKDQHREREDTESDSKSVQTPSLSADDSSRASSINNLECRSEVDDSGHWLLREDGCAPILKRSWSPVSMEESSFHRTPMGLGTLPDRPTCGAQRRPDRLNMWSTSIDKERDRSKKLQSQKLISSGEQLLTSSACGESKALIKQPTLAPESIDSDSETEEDSGSDDDNNDEWSGADDNIEAALYEAVYPDTDLAAHMVSTMYPSLVLNYRKKITRKVSSWQEKNIITCGTSSGTASTAKETASPGTSAAGNGSSPKRDRQSSSSDDNIDDDDDDDGEESRRKKPKEHPNSEPGIPRPRLACPFFKKDPVKYSAAESGRKSCSGPGWTSISQLKEHLSRAHRPVQCGRCYHVFPYKNKARSSAVSQRDQHLQQDEPCPRRSESLKEGINDAEWSRLSEEKKKKNRKGKGKRDITIPERTQSPLEQWYEIWTVLWPDMLRPSTPWYPQFHPNGLPRNQHFLVVSKNINEFKLSAIKDAIKSGSDDDLLSLLLECDQQKYSVYHSTFMAISDTTTDSFSNIGEHDIHSSEDGTWQKLTKDMDGPQQSTSQLSTDLPHLATDSPLSAIDPPLPAIDSATQTDHSKPVGTSNPAEAMMGRREIGMNGNPQTLAPNATYALENIHAPPQQRPSVAVITSPLQVQHVDSHSNHSARSGMTMDRNLQNVPQNASYVRASQAHYDNYASRYTPTSQVAYSNASNESFEPIWSSSMYDLQVPGDFDLTSFEQPHTSLPSHQWGDQYSGHPSRRFRRDP